jgi:hypothetical protein
MALPLRGRSNKELVPKGSSGAISHNIPIGCDGRPADEADFALWLWNKIDINE